MTLVGHHKSRADGLKLSASGRVDHRDDDLMGRERVQPATPSKSDLHPVVEAIPQDRSPLVLKLGGRDKDHTTKPVIECLCDRLAARRAAQTATVLEDVSNAEPLPE